MMTYLLHLSVLVFGAYLFYWVLLEKETFFQLNRWILLGGILLMFALPFLQIPEEWSLRPQLEKVEFQPKFTTALPSPISSKQTKSTFTNSPECPSDTPDISMTAIPLKKPIELKTRVTKRPTFSYQSLLYYLYFSGLLVFIIHFLIQLLALVHKFYRLPSKKEADVLIVEIPKNKAPFSFWNRVFMNPEQYDEQTYQQILQHERIHISEKHSLDILLAELLVVILWFNPFAWWYRKAVENNLEYLTDQKMLRLGTDRQHYQMSLLKVAVPNSPLSLTNNYNQSFLKKRISMMNTQKSSLRSIWKYLFLLPVLGLSVLCLNAVKINAKGATASFAIEADQPKVSNEFIPLSSASQQSEEPSSGAVTPILNPPVASASPSEKNTPTDLLKGQWSGTLEGNEVCLSFNRRQYGENHYWNNSQCYPKSRFAKLPIDSEGVFEITADAGSVELRGRFTNQEGIGHYTFTENSTFRDYLQQEGYTDITEDLLFQMALSDVGKNYLAALKKEGYQMTQDEFEMIAHLAPDIDFLKNTKRDLTAMGYTSITLEKLIQLHLHEVDMAYVKQLQQMGFDHLSLDNIIQASIHDISPNYMESLKTAGLSNLSFEELLQFAIHDIKPADINGFKAMGFRDLSTEEIIQAGIHGVTPEYFDGLKAAGLKDLSMEEIVQFAIHDVTPQRVQEFKSMGFDDLSTEQIIQFAIHDVTPKAVREFRDMGFKNLTSEEMIAASIHGVTPQYFKELETVGLTDLKMEQITQLAIHDIRPKDVVELQKLGFGKMNFDDIVMAGIHDVDASFIRGLNDLGFKDISMDLAVALRIHDVDAAYIKKQQAAGKQGLTLKEYLDLRIMEHSSYNFR